MRERLSVISVTLSFCLLAGVAARAEEPVSPPEAAEEARPRTLFQRIGGTYVLARVVDLFVNNFAADPLIRGNATVRREMTLPRRAGLKFQITTLLCQETGGPCKYEGRTLREAHLSMGISEGEWNAAMTDFKKALTVVRVPPAERAELVNLLTTAKDDIVPRH